MPQLWSFRGMVAACMALIAAFTLMAGSASASPTREPRIALVIANGDYASFDRLGATAADGQRIASALGTAGFVDASGSAPQVNRDLTQAQMLAKLAELETALKAAGPEAFGVLYFSGHGAALSSYGDLLLLPIDADAKALNTDLTRAKLTRMLMRSGAHNVLIVLDMCRNVLDAPPALRSDGADSVLAAADLPGSKGLKRISRQAVSATRPDQGYLVAFSTSADHAAFDDGVFSRVLAEEIRRPQQNVADALKRTSDRVALSLFKREATYQKPTFDYGLQGAPPCFVSCDSAAGERFYDCASCPPMRIVPAGTAMIGSPAGELGRGRDEPLQHPLGMAQPFAIGTYEVTVGEWAACVRDGACRAIADWSKENPNPLIPAAGIGHDDAAAFVAWLRAQSGKAYRIPTAEEWEYAARSGSPDAFAWGASINPSDANYDQTAKYAGSPTAPYRGYPEAVNAYPPNAFGLFQMSGNVWEWTETCADAPCKKRVIKGGSFESVPGELRLANRFAVNASGRRDDLGLRVVRDLDTDETGR